jgi:hypothetical protein
MRKPSPGALPGPHFISFGECASCGSKMPAAHCAFRSRPRPGDRVRGHVTSFCHITRCLKFSHEVSFVRFSTKQKEFRNEQMSIVFFQASSRLQCSETQVSHIHLLPTLELASAELFLTPNCLLGSSAREFWLGRHRVSQLE